MEPPKDAKVLVSATSVAWKDENGIVCSVSIKAPQPSIDQTKKTLRNSKVFSEIKNIVFYWILRNPLPPPKKPGIMQQKS